MQEMQTPLYPFRIRASINPAAAANYVGFVGKFALFVFWFYRYDLTSASVRYPVKEAAFLGLHPHCIASPACSSLLCFSLWSL